MRAERMLRLLRLGRMLSAHRGLRMLYVVRVGAETGEMCLDFKGFSLFQRL